MSWAYELTEDAQEDLHALPRKVQEQIARALDRMITDGPFLGDVKALKGNEWQGVFRRRLGSHRILFTADQKKQMVTVIRVLRRSEKTYR